MCTGLLPLRMGLKPVQGNQKIYLTINHLPTLSDVLFEELSGLYSQMLITIPKDAISDRHLGRRRWQTLKT